MTTSSHSTTAAANRLSEPSERGSLGYAYRRSVMALSSVLGYGNKSNNGDNAGEGAANEREPLLQAGDGGADQAGPSYGSVLDLPPERRVPKPKPVKSPVRVEAKVWFANERTWMSWLRVSLLIGSFSLAMYNSAGFFSSDNDHLPPPNGTGEPGPEIPPTTPNGSTIRAFAIIYALISILTLSWGLFNYHRRLYLIKTKFAGEFSDLIGPPTICLVLFVAVLVNFIVRVQEHNFDQGH